MNRGYVDYYFGIRSFEASTVMSQYDGVRSTNGSATLLNNYALGKHFEFLLWGGQKRYGAGVKHSPTVGLSNTYYAGAGVMWHFL
jgi:outer membrane protein